MWTARETARALRGEKAAITRAWQAEAQTRLWHLDKALLTRRGAAMRLADTTLTLLTEYHQFRPPPFEPSSLATAASEPEAASSEAASASPTPSATDASAAARAVNAEASGTVERQVFSCAENWTALPIAWADARALLELLCTRACDTLSQRGADADTLALCQGFFATLTTLVADRRIAQLDQQLASKREESDVAQHLASRFLANASHELRTPLTAVMGFAELLLEETYGPLTAEQRTAISHIDSSAQNLLEVINNVLDLLRIRSG